MTTIAPPGWECQPEESPGAIVILATTICKPGLTVRLPWDNVPWPNRTLPNPGEAGVAAPGTALATNNRPTSPTVITASRIARLVSVFIRDSFAQMDSSSEPRLDNALGRLARLPYMYGSFYGVTKNPYSRATFSSSPVRDRTPTCLRV